MAGPWTGDTTVLCAGTPDFDFLSHGRTPTGRLYGHVTLENPRVGDVRSAGGL